MKNLTHTFVFILLLGCNLGRAYANDSPLISPTKPLPTALNSSEIGVLISAVDKGLEALSKTQVEDGSFPTLDHARPAVASFAIMAYLSRGHKPGSGPYGRLIEKALNYVLSCQKDSGIFAHEEVNYDKINVTIRGPDIRGKGGTAKSYNHAICMLMLGEVYGLTNELSSFRIKNGISKGLQFSLQLWDIRKGSSSDDGGFRYTRPWRDRAEGDLSVTGWHISSLRSIRNAGFDIPQKVMNRIAAYVMRNQNSDGSFCYTSRDRRESMGITAAGILCMALAGKYNHPNLKKSCIYLSQFDANIAKSFQSAGGYDYSYYNCYYVTQATIQMGGELWKKCMKECYNFLVAKQIQSGLWPENGRSSRYGTTYSTALAIIALTPPLQILPIYQR